MGSCYSSTSGQKRSYAGGGQPQSSATNAYVFGSTGAGTGSTNCWGGSGDFGGGGDGGGGGGD
ncbi:hypothetical protein COCSUDRAFT_56064 [Coccomyxa subellipsoidea C-169]|uniref:Uncharacterized protein n=1 Tax=Coccomyxa subellipsoidea (strain C-169) TaxID=574566 RepID=I0YVF6_COCSC|nr:hypothetical protein COCSUDRAFT_56064 [Coccomyxa subellipsoidea C-169]EIE22375.1 hypothetical protein COCSUDRAFT_56064 [Coccomyxa subellipsoidea C-169]|eukprot:XP_005646919.1 hypothetical protein COCSUDRAFT_56064 [Coccomyxa subellipsoidea C-169]